jgi:hypothetical protein
LPQTTPVHHSRQAAQFLCRTRDSAEQQYGGPGGNSTARTAIICLAVLGRECISV